MELGPLWKKFAIKLYNIFEVFFNCNLINNFDIYLMHGEVYYSQYTGHSI